MVLHILPVDLARGAQTYARELRQRLDQRDDTHRTLTLFRSESVTLDADYRLGTPNGGLRRLGFDPRAAWRLRRALRTVRPDVVVAHGAEPLKYAVAAGAPRARLVYYRIGIGSSRLHGIRRLPYRFLFRRPAVIAAVSHDVADDVVRYGVEPKRVCVIPNARDAARYDVARELPEPGSTRLAFVGRMIESKRPLAFVEVVRALRESGCAVEGIMAGAGPLLSSVVDAARGLPVQVMGEVEDVRRLFATSDVFVFTSVAAGEGMPGVLIEAGLASLPVVTTDVPGARDVIEHGKTGLIVAIDGPDELLAAVRRMVDNPSLRATMGARARERCEALFGFEQNMQQWRTLIDDVMNGICEFST